MKKFRRMAAWAWGLCKSPYATAEVIAAESDPIPGSILFILVTAAAMAVHSGVLSFIGYDRAWHPWYFLQQCGISLAGLLLAVTGIRLAVWLAGGEATWMRIFAFWTFSYMPTSLFYGGGMLGVMVLQRLFGRLAVVPQPILLLGWFFALLMLLWKVWLLLTALRVIGNLTLSGVAKAGAMVGLELFIYWWAIWALQWQRIPYV